MRFVCCFVFRACPRRPGRRRGARPRGRGCRAETKPFRAGGRGRLGPPGAAAGRGPRGAIRAGRTAERGAVRPSVPGALALAPALRLPARDGTSYQRTTSRDWSSGRANGYAANAALSCFRNRSSAPAPARRGGCGSHEDAAPKNHTHYGKTYTNWPTQDLYVWGHLVFTVTTRDRAPAQHNLLPANFQGRLSGQDQV